MGDTCLEGVWRRSKITNAPVMARLSFSTLGRDGPRRLTRRTSGAELATVCCTQATSGKEDAMALTHWEMERRSGPESWRRIRHLRSSPIIAAQSPSLSDSFTMSLQQAEQQFRAAQAIGFESRPLNLFYGLSQGGRALAAAFEAVGNNQGFELQGHGIKCTNFGELAVDPIGRFSQLAVRSQGNNQTSFNKLSRLLASEPLRESADLGTLWGMLVEPQLHEPLSYPSHPVLLVEGDPERPSGGRQNVLMLSSVPAGIDINDAAAFAGFVDSYPTLRGGSLSRLAGTSTASGRRKESQIIELSWQHEGLATDMRKTYSLYRGSRVVLPAPSSGRGLLHPLMTWWAILFSLSMLARYEPRTWTQLIDVNTSPHAVSIEYLLDAALDSVPDVLADTIGALFMPGISAP